MSVVERAVAACAFPLFLAGAVAAAIRMMQTGHAPEDAAGPPVFVAGLGILVLERLFPLEDLEELT